jgi:hypothetical protein
MPSKVADFLRTAELDDAERATALPLIEMLQVSETEH